MKEKKIYESPDMEIIEICLEKGFADSLGGSGENGGWVGSPRDGNR